MISLRSCALLSALTLLALACVDDPPADTPEPPPLIQPAIATGYPTLTDACTGPVAEPATLVVSSTDFNTGAVGLIDVASMQATPDLALASADAVPIVQRGRVFVLNRFGFDWLDELDGGDDLASLQQLAIVAAGTDASANAHGLALADSPDPAPDSAPEAWVSLHGAGELQRLRFPTLSSARARFDLAVDLSSFADADQNPELGTILPCGALLFVAAARIDRSSWTPADQTLLIPIDVGGEQPAVFDFDPEHPGADAIVLQGEGFGPWRLTPPALGGDGTTRILVLNSGLEQVDLAAGVSEWLVPASVFLEQGLGRLQLAGFDLDSLGRVWFAAAETDFSSYGLWRVDLEDMNGPVLIREVDDLRSVTGALEIVGDRAWFADTTLGRSGLRVFDLAASPVTEVAGSPVAVGLPPMSLAPL